MKTTALPMSSGVCSLPNGMLLLFDPDRSSEGGDIPPHGAKGPGHLALAVGREEFPAWQLHFEEHGVEIEEEVEWGRSGGFSLYFRDPAGNSLELTCPETWGGSS